MIKSKSELWYVIPKLMSFPVHSAASASSSIKWTSPQYHSGNISMEKIMNEKFTLKTIKYH